MAGFSELPPVLRGSERAQLAELREYLVRLVRGLEQVESAAVRQSTSAFWSGEEAAIRDRETVGQIRNQAVALKSLIIKTADRVTAEYDRRIEELRSLFVAESEFGQYKETIRTQIETTARGIVESYDYREEIAAAQDDLKLLQHYTTAIQGEIRRGMIEDPEHPGTVVTGIAISQNLHFTGVTQTGEDGYTYYELASGQTFGLYTSTGWQFWIDGAKKGWFSSLDGMLHVANIVVEQSLQLGSAWQLRSSVEGTRLDIVYVGG